MTDPVSFYLTEVIIPIFRKEVDYESYPYAEIDISELFHNITILSIDCK